MNFKDVLDKNKTLFYHFLDGFINSDDGNTSQNIIKFINDNKLVHNDIFIMKYKYTSSFYELSFENLKDNQVISVITENLIDLKICLNVALFLVILLSLIKS